MEKLFKHLKKYTYLLLLCSTFLNGQNKLYVIETSGNPHIQNKNEYKSINKGDYFMNGLVIQLENMETIKLIDDKGELYHLTNAGSYSYTKVIAEKVSNSNTSVTRKYFNYLYKKMLNNSVKNTNAGVVYRSKLFGDLVQPKNNISIINDTIRFEWINDENKTIKLCLTDVKTNENVTISLNGSYITLPVDYKLFQKGKEYSWFVMHDNQSSESRRFSIASDIDKIELNKKVQALKTELKKLAFTKEQIQDMISDYYNIQM